MVFSSEIFLFTYLPLVLALYYLLFVRFKTGRNYFLLAASLLFYAWAEPKNVLLMLAVILINWLLTLLIMKNKKAGKGCGGKGLLALAVAANLGILAYYKYTVFTIRSINQLLNKDLTVPDIALPIGISFFIFQAMSYTIDVYRGNGDMQKNPFNVGLYISFFPQLIAGPIVRYETVAKQIKGRRESFSMFSNGVCRFILGLAKKVIIANSIGQVADASFRLIMEGTYRSSVLMAWAGAISYTLQIYFDFSGYSDMAIGLGKMFGFQFEENFNYPYISKSVSEFWRRWHISLQTWFRDYVYFPLGGSRVDTKKRLVFNLFVVWTLTGIWHGANWTFLLWGIMYFLLLTVEKLTGFWKKLGVFGHIYTLFFVVIGWVVFRADSLRDLLVYLGAMFGAAGGGLVDEIAIGYIRQNSVYYLTGIIASTPVLTMLDQKMKERKGWNICYIAALLVLFGVAITFIFNQSYNPFIYYNF